MAGELVAENAVNPNSIETLVKRFCFDDFLLVQYIDENLRGVVGGFRVFGTSDIYEGVGFEHSWSRQKVRNKLNKLFDSGVLFPAKKPNAKIRNEKNYEPDEQKFEAILQTRRYAAFLHQRELTRTIRHHDYQHIPAICGEV